MDYKKMIDELLELLSKEHLDFYFEKTEEEVKKIKEEALEKYEIKDIYDFYYVANYLIKHIIGNYDEHTKFFMAARLLPFTPKIINGKMYVVETSKSFEHLKFKEITKVNDVEVKKLLDEIENISCYFTNGWFEALAEDYFRTELLRCLPSIDNEKDLTFEIGNEKINVSSIQEQVFDDFFDKNMTYEVNDDIVRVIYNMCVEKKDGQMQEMVDKLGEETASKYIIDIRGNRGGNSEIIKPLINFLKSKEIITLTDKYVFSSGLFACTELKNIGSKFIGTDIGTTYNAFGNCNFFDFHGFKVMCSYKYFYYDEIKQKICLIKDKEEFKQFKNNKRYFEKKPFEIDEHIDMNVEDYVIGEDIVLECAKREFSNSKRIR